MRNAYLSALYDLAKDNKDVIALISDNGAVVYDKYREDFPDQFLNMGISEANMVGVSAGLASCGKIPFAYTISNFLTMRAFEQVRNDVCYQNMNVKLVGIGVGFVYSNLGPTHHGTEDIALMRSLPNMTIFSPCDPLEARNVTLASAKINGPVYIRFATGGTPKIYENDYDFEVGKAVTLREGSDVSIIATGSIMPEVLDAVDKLKDKKIRARLINVHTLKPIDKETLIKAAKETKAVVTIDEHTIHGGLGSIVAEVLADHGVSVPFKRMGLDKTFSEGYGSYADLKEINNVSSKSIVDSVLSLI